MKKWCLALVLVLAMAGSAWSKEAKFLGVITEKGYTLYIDTFTKHFEFKNWKVKEVSRAENKKQVIISYEHNDNIISVVTYDKKTSRIVEMLYLVAPEKLSNNEEKDIAMLNDWLHLSMEAIIVAASIAFPEFNSDSEFLVKFAESFAPNDKQVQKEGKKVTIKSDGITVNAWILKTPFAYSLSISKE